MNVMDKIATLGNISLKLDSLIREYQEIRAKKLQEDEELASQKSKDEIQRAQLGDLPFRVMHINNNPIDKAIGDRRREIESLRQENERIRAKISLLETGANDSNITRRIDDAVDSLSQIEMLARQVSDLKLREEKILNSFKKTSREFREVCYLLTGYRIDPLKDDIFRLSHMYAEHEEDRLYFEVKRDGTILLLKNEYTDQYNRFIRTYLEEADSFPAFLAAITLDLFKAQTQSVDMSVTMSTTVLPANTFRSYK